MAKLHLRITTPEGNLFDGEVDDVVLPAVDPSGGEDLSVALNAAEIDILPMHAATITLLRAGELVYRHEGKTVPFAIERGVAEILDDEVSVLTEGAIDPDAIDVDAVEKAIERAKVALNDPELAAEDQDSVRAMLATSLAQARVKKKWRG